MDSQWGRGWLVDGLADWLGIGLGIGLLIGGGKSVFQHYVMRYHLSRKYEYLPWDLEAFLDYAADLILLRKIGGGYIFIHRLVMEHIAEME